MVSTRASRCCSSISSKALSKPQALLVAGVVGVEAAGEVEGGSEAGFPRVLIGSGGALAAIEQGEARAAGPAEDFHLGEEIVAQRPGGIDDVEDARTLDERLQQAFLVAELRRRRWR